jgi:2-keto-4-pentenoate hydratase/2-oxohepta-3-ene-1,7-dioic acid hydratase in catechol pathway
MRWATYVSPADGSERVGVVRDGLVHGLREPVRLLDLLGDDGERLATAAQQAVNDPAEVVAQAEVRLRAPIPLPPSIRDFMAFEAHVRTARQAHGQAMDPDWYELPVFYFTNPAAVHGPNDDIPISPGSQQFDYELEVAAVIGRGGADLHPDTAEEHIGGYLLLCDWSARDLQAREMRQRLGPVKGKDGATSFGPVLVTSDELAPLRQGTAFDLRMTASVNGRPYSAGNLADLYWSFGQLLAYASRGTRLLPGDVIGSGTVGTGCILELSAVHGEQRYPWLRPGDEVELAVGQLGSIRSRITAAPEPIPLRAGGRS